MKKFFKWANPGLFFDYFRPFQTNNTILQQINEKNLQMSIQYIAMGFKPMTFEHEASPIITRPGLLPPPKKKNYEEVTLSICTAARIAELVWIQSNK